VTYCVQKNPNKITHCRKHIYLFV